MMHIESYPVLPSAMKKTPLKTPRAKAGPKPALQAADTQTLTAKVPSALLRRLDAAARQNERSRSAEMRVRLEASFHAAADHILPARQVRGAR